MYEHFAVDAFITLPTQAPNPIRAKGTHRSPTEPLGLEEMSIDPVELPPPAGASPIHVPVLAGARQSGPLRHIGEHTLEAYPHDLIKH